MARETIARGDGRENGAAVGAGAGAGGYTIAVLGKALGLLDVLEARQPLSLTELADTAGINKATVFRILANFEARGYVERDEATGQYRLGFRLIQLGTRLVESLDLRTVARPWLTRLQAEFGETVNLAIPRDQRIVYIDILETARGLRMTAPVGSEDHFHSTALGKAMLASWPPERVGAFLDGGHDLVRKTPRTIVDPDALRAELATVRARGFAVDHEENDLGARCVGAPLLDHRAAVVGAISVSGPAGRVDDERVQAIGARVRSAARQISEHMGHRATEGSGEGRKAQGRVVNGGRFGPSARGGTPVAGE